jgi:hypothetical protein
MKVILNNDSPEQVKTNVRCVSCTGSGAGAMVLEDYETALHVEQPFAESGNVNLATTV